MPILNLANVDKEAWVGLDLPNPYLVAYQAGRLINAPAWLMARVAL